MKISSNKKKFNKIMIVAHPDDELIFGGAELIKNKGYKVICITNQNNLQRRKEFIALMNDLKQGYELFDHTDNMNMKNVKEEYKEYVEKILTTNKIEKIVTHNKKGEYGHNFHRAVHNMVNEICVKNKLDDKLYYFHTGSKKIEDKLITQKLELMKKYYPSQYKVLERLNLQKSIENETLKKKKSIKNTKINTNTKK